MHVMGIAGSRVQHSELVRRKRRTPMIAAIVALLALATILAVAAPAAKAGPLPTCTWVGGGDDGAWSNPANWQDGVVPTNGANLVFAGTAQQHTQNDLDIDTLGTVTFQDPGFTVTSPDLDLRGDIDNDISSGATSWTGTLSLQGDATITDDAGGELILYPRLYLDGHTLTVTGGGTFLAMCFLYSPGSLVVASGTMNVVENNTGIFTDQTTVMSGATLILPEVAGLGGTMTVAEGGTVAGLGMAQDVSVAGAILPSDFANSLPGTLSDIGDETWQPGGSLTCIATGVNDFDQVSHLYVNGGLAIDSTTDSPFTIHLRTNRAGISDFDNTQSYSWDVVKAWGDDGIAGYLPDNVVLDTSGVQADLGGGSFSLRETGGYTSDIWVDFTPAPSTYTLTYTAGEHGSIDGDSPQTVDAGDDGSQVTAVPDAGYHFTGWSDDVQTAARTDTDVSGDVDVTANFAINTCTLTYTADAHGSIDGDSSQNVDYGDDGSQVTAVPDAGYHFTGWSDGVQTAARTDTEVADDLSVTAHFAANPTTPPTTTVSGVPDGWSRVPVTLHFSATPAQGCTIDRIEYRYGDLDWTTGASCPISLQGVTVVSYRAVDDWNNVEPTQTCTVRIDGVRPAVSGGAKVTVRRGAKATFGFRLADNCATRLTCKLIVTQYSKTKLVVAYGSRPTGKAIHVSTRIGLPAGRYSWRVSAFDTAGNRRLGPIHILIVAPPLVR